MNKISILALSIGAILSHNVLAQTISGTIVDKSGQPISKAKVALSDSDIVVFTDKEGRFSVKNLSSGVVELHVTANSFSHNNQNVEVLKQDINNINIVLSPTVFDIINVNATPLHTSSVESALPINVLSAEDLRMKQASTLGETLKNEVGVHSSYYGPVSSSPIIRGLDGPRVMITQNGLDAGDASRVGPDHAVSSETSTATQIEVLRGPATLFYGSGAIGGVVNVVDNRVPHTQDTTAEWLLEHNTVSLDNLVSVSYNTAIDDIGYHFDSFWRKSGDYKLAGEADLHHDEHKLEHEDQHADEIKSNRLENSSSKSNGFTAGTSYLMDNGFVGISYGRVERQYDVPGHADHEEGADPDATEPSVYADMRQNRYQFITELTFAHEFVSAVHSKFAYTDYLHKEIEGVVVGTTFDNASFEGRFDVFHNEVAGFSGAFSLHYKESDFTAIGAEAFTPPSKTDAWAVSWLEEKHFDDVLVQFGARLEHLQISAAPVELSLGEHEEHSDEVDEGDDLVAFDKQSFNPLSASVGLIWDFSPGYNFAISAAYSQRAPSASEMFSFGAHIGTRSFETGILFDVHPEDNGEFHIDINNQKVEMETSFNLDFTLRKYEGELGFVFNTFYNQIDDFYYQQHTGLFLEAGHGHDHTEEAPDAHEDEAGLPVLVYARQNATMYGFEGKVIYQLSDPLKLTVYGDYIRGKLDGGTNLPRIPPMRLGVTLNYEADNFSTEFNLSRFARQQDTSFEETQTAGYTMIDLNFNYYLDSNLSGAFGDMTVYFKVHNLTDEHARVHSSFLKDIVPLPGRGFTLGFRGGF
ncbi:MAG: TonB-dependent receptor [Algicola sp.]|nr:TonB-dependent receptor [Algicola sp.]